MPEFSDIFRDQFWDLLRWRRDVRRFHPDSVDPALLKTCLKAFDLAPSVGLSEPWRLIQLTSDEARAKALANFEAANAQALAGYEGERAELYAGLKLSGMQVAPVQLAVFCDDATDKGAGLGAASMPETRAYSVVGALTQFWLALRAYGLGMGWVSILDPVQLSADLGVPESWRFVGYLCIGWPKEETDTPALETAGWETRADALTLETR